MGRASAGNPGGLAGPQAAALFERDLVVLMPALRRFSYSVCRDRTLAEDVAQQALMKAWRAQSSFKTGTNLKAWLFTILRNEFYSHTRRAWRETHWDADVGEQIPAPADEQEWALNLSDTGRALGELPKIHREALIMVAVGGHSLDDTAKHCGALIGTVKSRVSRARIGLTKLLGEGTSLPRRAAGCGRTASEDMLAQLSSIVPASTIAAVRV